MEFKGFYEIADRYPDGVQTLKDGGTWNLIAGQPTDDSEMALALARSLVAAGRFDTRLVADAYVRWLQSDPFDIGYTTSSGLEAISAGRRATSGSQANGALMRISPAGIFANADPGLAARIAAKDALLTHPHPVCQSANAAYAAAIAIGIAGGDSADMWQAAHEHAASGSKYRSGAAPVRDRLEAARRGPPEDFQNQMGWVLTAFQNAFFICCQVAHWRTWLSGPLAAVAIPTQMRQLRALCWDRCRERAAFRRNGAMPSCRAGPMKTAPPHIPDRRNTGLLMLLILPAAWPASGLLRPSRQLTTRQPA